MPLSFSRTPFPYANLFIRFCMTSTFNLLILDFGLSVILPYVLYRVQDATVSDIIIIGMFNIRTAMGAPGRKMGIFYTHARKTATFIRKKIY